MIMDGNHVLSLVILTVIIVSCSSEEYVAKPKPSPTPYHDWDYLVYSQRWPITACSEWEEKGKANTCNLPSNSSQWTIHGLWPTKIGNEGPFFCPSALHFDVAQLQPFLADLEKYWVNVEANTQLYSFWKHEWNKHGTCASIIPQLNSVTNYFKHGLSLNRQYMIADILAKDKIVPNADGYQVQDIAESIRSYTGKVPTVQCVIDGITKESYINEIRICFNKNLDVIDCNVTKSDDATMSNCNLKKPVMYLAHLPNATQIQPVLEGDLEDIRIVGCLDQLKLKSRALIRLYNSLKLLIWITF